MALTDKIEFPGKSHSTIMFFLIETSNNMAGSKIETVNNFMKSFIPEISETIYTIGVKIAALCFHQAPAGLLKLLYRLRILSGGN